jgi:flagellar biosynthesis protein FlhG
MNSSGTRVISFASGKGGVGKTSLVANLGSLWADRGCRTLLIDGDWSLGKLGITLGVRPQWTIESVIDEEMPIRKVVQPVGNNLSFLASPTGVMGLEELSEGVRNQLFFELESLIPDYDRVLFDHSSGIHWGVLQFAAASHEHVIVTTPEPTSYTDAYAIMKILSRRFGVRNFWLLVTMSHNYPESERIIDRFTEVTRSHLDVSVKLLDILEWEPLVSASIRNQKPFVDTYPAHKLTGQFSRILDQIEKSPISHSHGLNFFYPGETCENRKAP